MSTLRVTEIQSNSTAFNTPVRFETSGGVENGTLCKVWASWNGYGTVAIRADFNVNSISDNSAGDYTVNFSNSLASANYACVGGSRYAQSGASILSNFHDSEATSSVRVYTVGSAYYDCERVDIACFL